MDDWKKKYAKNNKKPFSSFEEFKKKILENWSTIHGIPKDTPKGVVNTILHSLGFEENYLIGELNKRLIENGGAKDVILSISNFSYIISRHGSDFINADVLLNMPLVLSNYDVVTKGKKQLYGDFVFYKIFEDGKYGIEMNINKISDESDEYIVHYLMVGHKRNKLLKKYLMSDTLVDKRK